MTITQQPSAPTGEAIGGHDPHSPATAVRMTETVARFAVEIVRDMRPAATLSRLVVPEISVMLERRAQLTRRLRGAVGPDRSAASRIVVRGVRTCIVSDTVVEASAVVHERDRARFLALRWELRPRGWRVTVLELG